MERLEKGIIEMIKNIKSEKKLKRIYNIVQYLYTH